MSKVNIETQAELLSLRNQLQKISNLSFAFKRLTEDNPLNTLNQETALQLVAAYKQLLEETE